MQSEAATFSDIETTSKPDYNISFSKCQKLLKLRSKLERSLSILQFSMEVDKTLLSHAQGLVGEVHAQVDGSRYLNSVLQQQQSTIQGHICRVRMLLQSCDFTAQMVGIKRHTAWGGIVANMLNVLKLFQLLGFRSDNLLHQNGNSLREFASAASSENKSMLSLSKETSIDSRATRIAAFISLAYLPAGVVAVSYLENLRYCSLVADQVSRHIQAIFNSNLVDLGQSGQSGFVVRKEMWIFVLLTVGLSWITLMAWWILERKQKSSILQSI